MNMMRHSSDSGNTAYHNCLIVSKECRVLGTEAGPHSAAVVVHGRLLGARMRVEAWRKRGLLLETLNGIWPASAC